MISLTGEVDITSPSRSDKEDDTMSDVFKFPNGGFPVEICRKNDIIADLNIDSDKKEIVLAIVTQCEADANNVLKNGGWAGIPYLGNMRIPEYKTKFREAGNIELLETAKETLDDERYRIFKRQLNANIACDIKRERFYKYVTSCYVTKHRKLYNLLATDDRALDLKDKYSFARFMCYSFTELSPCVNIE